MVSRYRSSSPWLNRYPIVFCGCPGVIESARRFTPGGAGGEPVFRKTDCFAHAQNFPQKVVDTLTPKGILRMSTMSGQSGNCYWQKTNIGIVELNIQYGDWIFHSAEKRHAQLL